MMKPVSNPNVSTPPEAAGLWDWLVSTRDCFTLIELDQLVRESGPQAELDELRARFHQHVDVDGCLDCRESRDVLQLMSRAADSAINEVISLRRYGKAC